MAMIAITMAAEAVEKALLEHGAISPLRERRVSRAFAIDPLAQHTFVVETDVCRTQAAVMFGHVVAQLALPLADGFIKIHLRSP
jgi:hypothetical protein